jgi:formylglycine-generating enzyme required for sulfatase activity
VGVDQFGEYAEFTVQGRSGLVTQRLRWIHPGEFWMGSPKAESERMIDGDYAETLHRVILTRGYWLADTACTQALWEVVLGEKPSRFTGDSANPVEQVSWNDVKERFLPALNLLVPGLEAQLPTEAQWEYACRAGTGTPFWFGEKITPDLVNYNGNYPYRFGQVGKYREEPVPVKSLPANGWGLYEMHGNVFEWCEDILAPYPQGPLVDPVCIEDSSWGRRRVLRGGSWGDGGAGLCRSAYRYASVSDARFHFIGFRLAARSGVLAQPKFDAGRKAAKEKGTKVVNSRNFKKSR